MKKTTIQLTKSMPNLKISELKLISGSCTQ